MNYFSNLDMFILIRIEVESLGGLLQSRKLRETESEVFHKIVIDIMHLRNYDYLIILFFAVE